MKSLCNRWFAIALMVALMRHNAVMAQDAGTGREAPARRSGGLFGWLCTVLGVSCEPDAAEVREDPEIEPRHGRRVLRTRPLAHAETEIYACGECWAPTPMADGGVLVATPAGLLRIPRAGRAELIMRAPEGRRIATIIGRTREDPNSFLVVASTPSDGGARSFTTLVANTQRRSFAPVPNGIPQPVNGIDIERARSRSNRVRNGIVLRTSEEIASRPLLVQRSAPPTTGGAVRPLGLTEQRWDALAPALNHRDDGVNRFDPVWVGPARDVVYMADP